MWKIKLLISVILISLCIVSWKCALNYQNKTQFVDVCGTVYKKYDGSSKYGPEFIMIVRADNGIIFDVEVTPSTYATREVGDRVCFSDIQRSKVDSTYKDYTYTISFIWLAFNCIFVIAIIIILAGMIIDD